VRDNRGKVSNIKVGCVKIEEGSIEIPLTPATIGGTVYLFFKDYNVLKSGVIAFIRDIETVCTDFRNVVYRFSQYWRHGPFKLGTV